MAIKSVEHDNARMMRCPTPKKGALKRRPLDGDCNFEQLLFRLKYVESNTMASAMIVNCSCKGQRYINFNIRR